MTFGMAWDVSRLGRSLVSLVQDLESLHSGGIDLFLFQQALDTTTPSGKALFQMCGVFAEFERAMISERVKAGLSRAIREGRKLGRPELTVDRSAIIEGHASGLSIRQLARDFELSVGTVHNVIKTARTG